MNTVRRHLALEAVPKYERKVKRQTKLAPFEDYLRERQKAEQPDSIPATVLYREIAQRGYQGGMSQLGRRLPQPCKLRRHDRRQW